MKLKSPFLYLQSMLLSPAYLLPPFAILVHSAVLYLSLSTPHACASHISFFFFFCFWGAVIPVILLRFLHTFLEDEGGILCLEPNGSVHSAKT